MTTHSALLWATSRLKSKSPSAELDAEALLSYALKRSREYILTHSEKVLTPKQIRLYKTLIDRRAKHEPIAYITGHKEFYGLDFKVTPDVLIPRPETEMIVEETLRLLTTYNLPLTTLVDVGTGSGCIPVAIAKSLVQACSLNPKSSFQHEETSEVQATSLNQRTSTSPAPTQDIQIFATDISPAALRIARMNAKKHHVLITFLRGNLLEPINNNFPPKADQPMAETMKQWSNETIITANLPYLTTKQWRACPPDVRIYEPRAALDGGKDGLDYYRKLLRQISEWRQPSARGGSASGGKGWILILEIDPSQSKKIKLLIKKYLPSAKIEIKKDLAGRDRLVIFNRD